MGLSTGERQVIRRFGRLGARGRRVIHGIALAGAALVVGAVAVGGGYLGLSADARLALLSILALVYAHALLRYAAGAATLLAHVDEDLSSRDARGRTRTASEAADASDDRRDAA